MKYIVIPILEFILNTYLTLMCTIILIIMAIVNIMWNFSLNFTIGVHEDFSETIVNKYTWDAERRHYKNYLCAIWRIGKYTVGKNPNIWEG